MKRFISYLAFLLPVFLIIAFLIILFFGLQLIKPLTEDTSKTQSSITATEKQGEPATLIKWHKQTFAYALIRVKDINALKLINNQKKVGSDQLIKQHNCKQATNGSFYDQQNNPLGLLLIENETISPAIESELFNGYWWLSLLGSLGIDVDLPDIELQYALQSGPLLILNSEPLKLSINNDKLARRIMVVTTTDEPMIFLAIYDPNSVFDGPKLADLPLILQEIAKQENVLFVEALNLDGGSASMLKNLELYLNEFKPIGNMFCLTS